MGWSRQSAIESFCDEKRKGFRHPQSEEYPTPGPDSPDTRSKELHMSALDKAKNKVEDLGGHAKEATGKATGDKSTENEGKVDQVKANLKDAGEKVKDAFK
jgi:uncharacterized protein YjbJ (UPF0337 family)